MDFSIFWDANKSLFHIGEYAVSFIELLGTITGLLSVYFGTQNHKAVWYFGFVNVVCFAVIFFQISLYSDMLLQVFYFFATGYGLWLWGQKKESGAGQISTLKKAEYKNCIVVFSSIFLVFSGFSKTLPLLFHISQASFLYFDAILSSASVVATLLMAKRKIETWLLWIVIDFVSIAMYLQKGVHLIALEYAIFGVLAIVGFIQWKKNYNTST
jgi:nicotinamide mononucleotide transporter